MYMKVMRVAAPAAALLFALGFAGSAQAATDSTAGATAAPVKATTAPMTATQAAAIAKAHGYKVITVPMTVTGVNAAVAKAHGYKVETLANGKQVAVRPGAAAVSPQDTIPGDCGDAFLWFEPQGNKKVDIYTGFNLDEEAVFYYWDVEVTDSAGTGTKLFYGGLADDYTWSVNWITTHSVTGPGSAQVTDGWVTLYSGDDCTALNPSESGTIE